METKNNHWMPLYVGDYLKDTAELTQAEHGAYLRLIMFYWNNGGAITDDLNKVYRATGAISPDEQKNVASILRAFFTKENDKFFHKRIDSELNRCANIREVRSKAGRKGGRLSGKSRRSKNEANDEANIEAKLEAKTNYPQSQSQSYITDTVNNPFTPLTGGESKVNQKESKNEKPKRNTTSPFPGYDRCPDECANWASRNTSLSQSEIDQQYEIARDWATANGKRQADWLAFFRNWCRRAEQSRGSSPNKQKASVAAAVFARVVASAEARQRNEVLGGDDNEADAQTF